MSTRTQPLPGVSYNRPICPYCCHEHKDTTDFPENAITYWGDHHGPVEFTCRECEKEFYVQERVQRTWTIGRSPQETKDYGF